MGKYLLVGASSGLGRLCASKFVERGDEVYVIAREKKKDTPGHFFRCDLSDLKSVNENIKQISCKIGPLTGACFFQRLRDKNKEESTLDELAVSVLSTEVILKNILQNLDNEIDHPFVFVSSVNSRYVSTEMTLGYHISKAGLDILAKYFAAKFGSEFARFNTVNPGTFIKPERADWYETNRSELTRLSNFLPRKKMNTADNISDLILFLTDQKSIGINGQNMIIDGGASLRWVESKVGE